MREDASKRRERRKATWSSKLYRGPDVHAAMEADDLDEAAAMDALDRLALTWKLSLDQFGGVDARARTVSARLPRSAYRVERR